MKNSLKFKLLGLAEVSATGTLAIIFCFVVILVLIWRLA